MTRRLFAAIALSLVAGAPAMAQTAAPEHTIVSLPAENFGFLPFYVAQDRKIFEQQGLDVQKVVLAGVATTNGVISGAADFGFSNGASLTRAAARGQKLLAIAIMSDKPVWAIMMNKKLAEAAHFDPQAPLAERAKVFGLAHNFAIDSVNSVGHALTRVIEKIGGVDPESLPVTPLGATEAIAAFSRGAVDGFVSNPPWSEQILATGTAVIIANSLTGDPPWMTPFGSGVVITRPQFCADHRSVCVKMGHSLLLAVAFVHEHPADALAILRARFQQIDPAVTERSFAVIEKSMPKTPAIVEAAISNSDRLNIEAGFMKPEEKLSSYGDLFTNEYLQ
ncbi:MAG TPA: ABC transporter substrate-binding protein [Stellaceae bacterium]|jgi:NitT/TauT family transport system substrate-binding protein|nr:ABC transporter substrate-binding protein [Stellaceae bacterium]